ncbi:MAG: UDP-N-acetylmuramoyl-tripeptide--D-alanyl-D-alanine ligase [Pseudomonadota bacterium]
MSVLWTSADALAATAGSSSGNWEATGISIDTRSIQKGDLFVALRDQRDGHDFVADAFAKGAAAALVSYVPDGVTETDNLLLVDDVMAGLAALARAGRARAAAKVIGVTGSVGKTSTKEMLKAALEPSGQVHVAEGSFNNHWGVPLTLARMPKEADFAVIEIGMNAPGEIAPLSRLADLDVAMITTVAAVHLEAFEDVSGIAREKASIVEGLRPDGVAIVNADFETRPVVAQILEGRDLVWFGEATDSDPIFETVQVSSTGQHVKFLWHGLDHSFDLGASGRHFAINALGVLAAVKALGADPQRAMTAISGWGSPAGRGAQFDTPWKGGTIRVIDESYNANPTSMAAAFDVLIQAGAIRKIAIVGDMLELGEDEVSLHSGLAELPSVSKIDQVHTVGPLMEALHKALPTAKRGSHFIDAEAALNVLNALLLPGDAVMIKGSKGIQVSRLVTHLKTLGGT